MNLKSTLIISTALTFVSNTGYSYYNYDEHQGSEILINYYDGINGLLSSVQSKSDAYNITKSQSNKTIDSRRVEVAQNSISRNNKSNSDGTADENNTIIVTGSNIRGSDKPVGGQLITIDREEMNKAGYTSIRDVSENLPQNFSSGATGESQLNQDSSGNVSGGSTFNLRGLGQTATLTLVNGRRIPTGGYFASVADIATVPLVAIERVEVLPDGASAVYGADAVSGVVNVILEQIPFSLVHIRTSGNSWRIPRAGTVR